LLLAAHDKGFGPMHMTLPHLLRNILGLTTRHDEHLLAGADEASLQALGVSQSVLARFPDGVAVLCPDLLHETQIGLAGK
jgi:hypothetical protein